MSGVIVSGNFSKDLLPNVNKWFGDAYKNYETFYDKIFEMSTSDRQFEEDVLISGLGLARERGEGAKLMYDSMTQGGMQRYIHKEYGNGFVVTKIAMEDGQSGVIAKVRAEQLKKSMLDAREVIAANVINRATTSGYTGYDGVVLLSTAHKSSAGDVANKPATDVDFSEAAMEDAYIAITSNTVNDRGLRIAAAPVKLVVHPALKFDVERLMKSDLRVDTANNDINALKSVGVFSQGAIFNPYLTDTDGWTIITDVPNGLRGLIRRDITLQDDSDFDTDNAKYKATMRLVFGWSDFRGVYGSTGA